MLAPVWQRSAGTSSSHRSRIITTSIVLVWLTTCKPSGTGRRKHLQYRSTSSNPPGGFGRHNEHESLGVRAVSPTLGHWIFLQVGEKLLARVKHPVPSTGLDRHLLRESVQLGGTGGGGY